MIIIRDFTQFLKVKREAKVGELNMLHRINQEIRRFDIHMHIVCIMHMLYTIAHFGEDRPHLILA